MKEKKTLHQIIRGFFSSSLQYFIYLFFTWYSLQAGTLSTWEYKPVVHIPTFVQPIKPPHIHLLPFVGQVRATI